jgi:hypothetical protein
MLQPEFTASPTMNPERQQKGKNAPFVPEKRCKNYLNKVVFYATLKA